jgi:hypothetical protein
MEERGDQDAHGIRDWRASAWKRPARHSHAGPH